jgi:2',3'-cyclic-nucleotide 2'-phosphodiesterase (5'-nucleotidase family)
MEKTTRSFCLKQFVALITTMVTFILLVSNIEGEIFGAEDKEDIVILYTNDVHNAYVRDENGALGYAAVAGYKKKLESEGYKVLLVDGGDAIQGGVIGALSKGQYIVDIMEKMEYTLAIPGNHEFDFGMEHFLDIADKSSYDYISCNFTDLRTDKLVFEPYKIVEVNGKKIAFVGITTPETLSKSTPAYFKDENGNFIYGFCEGENGTKLYNKVQEAIDAALAEGADYVIAAGHAGIEEGSKPYRSSDIIANTKGIDAFLDAHSHSNIPNEKQKDKDGNEVILCSTGTKLESLGKLVISADGTITTELITDIEDDDVAIKSYIDGITSNFEAMINEVVAKTEVDLVVNDPQTGDRIVRKQETNLGDLCADAYRILLGADVGITNGGGVREGIKAGDITYGQIIAVNPFGNALCMVEATGQQILDALEKSMINAGDSENGSFLHVSGITFDVNTSIQSSVKVNEQGEFISVDGEYRVHNVKIGDKALELDKTYTLASHNYMLKNAGGGYVMFKNCKLILDEVILDYEALIKYIDEELGGNISKDSIYANPYGEGRINFVEENVKTGDNTNIEMYILILCVSALLMCSMKIKDRRY